MSNVQEVVKDLITHVVREGGQEERTVEGVKSTVYTFKDLLVVFEKRSKPAFGGMVFEALGKDFIVTPDFEILVTGVDYGTNEDDTFEVNSELFLDSLENFLEWRLTALKTLGV